MLKYIQSNYFIKIILSYLEEINKLKITKYNKRLQNYLNISLINYKFFSQKYIIYGIKGKDREFDGCNDSLIFVGKYLNRKRIGKRKEYDYLGKLQFEGEYLNGKRNGKGKEYYFSGY